MALHDMLKIPLVLAVVIPVTIGLDNGVAITPPMGFNSYMSPLSCGPGLGEAASFMVSSGLRDLGYVYINTDEGWEEKYRSNTTGKIIPKSCWGEGGLPGFISKLHKMGLKFGIYGAASGVTCGQDPGQLYHEDLDAQTYVDWGVDYLKSDNCASYAMDSSVRFGAMRDALNRTGKRVVLSIEPFAINPDPEVSSKVSNLWRIGCDIRGDIVDVLDRADTSDKWAPLAGPGGWNDPDMINVQNSPQKTLGFNRIYFGLWAIMKAPLLLSAKLDALQDGVLSIVNNTEVIAINQDALGVQARKISIDGQPVPWLQGLTACDSRPSKFFNRILERTVETDPRKYKIMASKTNKSEFTIVGLSTNRCMTNMNSTAVLLPCNEESSAQKFVFRQGLHTVSSIISVSTGEALTVGNTTLYSTQYGKDDYPVSDASYGNVNMSFTQEFIETPCMSRHCEGYDISQKWYYDPVEMLLRQATYSASINHRSTGRGYTLSPKVPTYRHHCLSHVLSVANYGTQAGTLEVWGGPLAGDSLVVALLNRGNTDATISMTYDMFEMSSVTQDSKYDIRDLWEKKSFLTSQTKGFKAMVAAEDIKIFKLTPSK